METVRVGGRNYSDPDVISLIKATGSLVDPRSSVLSQARALLAKLSHWEEVPKDPLERLRILASLARVTIEPMDIERQRKEKRDAILLTAESKRIIAYNPDRPRPRVAFTIAHEIAHTFFPNSSSGARFRSICESNSREANELERLCDLGASELLMPLIDFQRRAAGNFSLLKVQELCEAFGSSFEATAFRLATAHPGKAISGLLRYRLTLPEQRKAARTQQGLLFGKELDASPETPHPKYRRQSIHLSEFCEEYLTVRWNKSFDETSCVYEAGRNGGIHSAREALPNGSGMTGRLEAVRAPYQREEAHAEFADVLFFWTAD
jgi:Zn-dependent peptidase ImmA (M78 family)